MDVQQQTAQFLADGLLLFAGGGGGVQIISHQMALKETLEIKDQSCSRLRLSHKAMW